MITIPFISIPKDLTKVKSKIIFNLTKRQIICFSLGITVAIPTYLFMKNYFSLNTSIMALCIVMMPFFAFGLYEKDGQPLERILKKIIYSRFIAPKIRPYKTENFYTIINKKQNNKTVNSSTKTRVTPKGSEKNAPKDNHKQASLKTTKTTGTRSKANKRTKKRV